MIKKVSWSNQAEKQLKPAMQGSRKQTKRDVIAGRADLWSIDNGRLFVVTRFENGEFVFVAIAGKGLARSMKTLYNLAKSTGAPVARFHTTRPEALANAMRGWPIYLSETRKRLFARPENVYRIKL